MHSAVHPADQYLAVQSYIMLRSPPLAKIASRACPDTLSLLPTSQQCFELQACQPYLFNSVLLSLPFQVLWCAAVGDVDGAARLGRPDLPSHSSGRGL